MRNFRFSLLIVFVVGLFLALTLRASLGNPSNDDILGRLKAPGQAFESSQERARYALTESMVLDKTLKMDNFAKVALPDISYKNGHYYSVFPPGLSILITPAFYLGKLIGHPVVTTFAMPAIASILTAIFIFLISVNYLKLSRTSSFIAAITFSLATIAWSYSVTLYAHVFSALALVSALYFALRSREGSAFNHFLVWLIYGISILVDFPNAVILMPVIIYMIIESFRVDRVKTLQGETKILRINFAFLYTILPFALACLLLAYYNIQTFGSWSSIAHNFRVTSLVNGNVDYQFLISKAMDIKFVENGLYTLLLSKSRGILIYSPVLILSFLGFAKLNNVKAKMASLFAAIIFLNLAVYSSFYDPWGGWAYGPRYLIVTMPLLAILVGISYEFYKSKSLYLLVFIALFFSSFGIALLGALTTNLLPPSAETGSQIGFLSLVPKLLSGEFSSGLVFGKARELLGLHMLEFYILLAGLFAIIFLPAFLNQFIKNIIKLFKRQEVYSVSVIEKESNAN